MFEDIAYDAWEKVSLCLIFQTERPGRDNLFLRQMGAPVQLLQLVGFDVPRRCNLIASALTLRGCYQELFIIAYGPYYPVFFYFDSLQSNELYSFWVADMFSGKNASGKGFNVVIVQHWNCSLQYNRAIIYFRADIMHGTACNFHPGI